MSQPRIGGRRAAPPRPTLLVGDLAACQAAFGRLQQRVLELSLAQHAALEAGDQDGAAADAWRDLVPRCRALRETLTSLRELSHFTREVYECAADVCARAGDLGEALKALQVLVHHIYPALAAAEAAAGPAGAGTYEQPGSRPPGLQRQQQPEQAAPAAGQSPRRAGGGGWRGGDEEEAAEDAWLVGPSTQLDSPTVAAALQQPAFRRWPEVAGALVLYFTAARPAGAPAGNAQLDTLATLRRLPPPLLRAAEVRAALRLRAALAAGDYVALFRLREGAPPLVRALVSGSVAAAARERALVVLAVAYRNIAVAAVCRTLALDTPRLLLACLKLLADRGHAAAGRALSGLQQEEAAALPAADVVFKG
ncbi:hypothetical protein ABPG77_006240 [Micractinium sp. CCAP 211/92]